MPVQTFARKRRRSGSTRRAHDLPIKPRRPGRIHTETLDIVSVTLLLQWAIRLELDAGDEPTKTAATATTPSRPPSDVSDRSANNRPIRVERSLWKKEEPVHAH